MTPEATSHFGRVEQIPDAVEGGADREGLPGLLQHGERTKGAPCGTNAGVVLRRR
jgi:hypothetical protein